MTTDYKIVSKSIANRLGNIIQHLIHTDQSYSVPGRSIFDSLHLYREIIGHINRNNETAYIVSLDQKNAFDRIGHQYLFHVLEIYNFGPSIINYIRLLYKNASCMFRVANNLTAPIDFVNGIRQGCPLSGVLFTLSIEPLLNLIRRSITGYKLPIPMANVYLQVTAYADDINVIASKRQEIDLMFKCYDSYAENSGVQS